MSVFAHGMIKQCVSRPAYNLPNRLWTKISLVPQSTIFSTRYSVMCKVYTGYCGTSEIEHGLCACTVDNPLANARGLSLRTGAQTMLYLSLVHFILIAFNNLELLI